MEYKELKKLKDMVEAGLHNCQDCRNSDIKLTNYIWVHYYPDLLDNDKFGEYTVRLINLYKLPTEDSVKRIRAKLQNEKGLYLPTDEKVRKQRKISEEQWRLYLGYNPEFRTP